MDHAPLARPKNAKPENRVTKKTATRKLKVNEYLSKRRESAANAAPATIPAHESVIPNTSAASF
jgi:hypothetical protein